MSSLKGREKMKKVNCLDWLALLLVIIGAINWGIMGILQKDLIIGIIGLGWSISRIIYIVFGVAGIWTLFFIFPKVKK